MMIYTQTSFKHKKKKTKSRRKLAETSAYWEWRKKHGTHPSQLRKKKKDTSVYTGEDTVKRDTPHIPSLEESMEQKNGFRKACKVVSSNNSISTKIHPSNAAQLISNQSGERQRRLAHWVHVEHVSGGRPP